jgi:hypothetical protein
VDHKPWIKDLFSPSNLWSAAQWAFPAITAAVTGALSYVGHLPAAVIIFLATVSAASVTIVVSENKKASIFNKLGIKTILPVHWFWNAEDQSGAVQQKIVLQNSSDRPLYYYVDVLAYALQSKTNTVAKRLGDDAALIPPFQEAPFLLHAIGDLKEGDASGILRVRVQYGTKKDRLSHSIEAKFQLPCMVFYDETRQGMHMMLNYVIESLETK